MVKRKRSSTQQSYRPAPAPLPMIVTTIRHDCEILPLVGASNGVVEAMRCDDYMSQNFGNIGLDLLECISRAIASPEKKHATHTMTIQISMSEIVLDFHHPLVPPMFVQKALAWICSALRVQPPGGKEGVYTSFAENNRLSPLQLQQLPTGTDQSSSVHALFDKAIVAVSDPSTSIAGYPLLLSSDLMIQISGVEYPVRAGDGLILMGYSTALIPLERMDDGTIRWRLQINTEEEQVYVSDLGIQGWQWYQTSCLGDLKGRALLS
ncbi:hypothetical protein BJY04DRAFT_218866 [Aspergillus karnatakaensis]|uniref:uncharacterized protein n=1 Tax=Aspergillus karnatakaensis TaxID=1810916 RepID=UPI003CCD76DF